MDIQLLHLLFKCGKDFRHAKTRSCGISDTEFMICSYICSHAECSQDDAAKALRMDKTTLAKAVNTLEGKGYILRGRDAADARKNTLTATEKGSERIMEIKELHDRWFEKITSCLLPEEQKQFESYCARLLAAAERELSGNDDAHQAQ